MDFLSPSDLKSILHSKRVNFYYLEHCRVIVKGGRVEYMTEEHNRTLYFNIPIANTSFVVLGTGTSISQAAVAMFSRAGVMLGFSGTGGTPLIAGTEYDIEHTWIHPISEYRPNEYLQKWYPIWANPEKRLASAKIFQKNRVNLIIKTWSKFDEKVPEQLEHVVQELHQFVEKFVGAIDIQALFSVEALMTKYLYKVIAQHSGFSTFQRVKRGKGIDLANRFLDHGNYLAYGLGASATWVMGIPHAFSLMHGKTRRGALVFDCADIIKDAFVLPNAFYHASLGSSDHEMREAICSTFNKYKAMDEIIDSIKEVIDTY